MIRRLYVEKRETFRQEAEHLKTDLVSLLGIKGLEEIRIFLRYDVEGVSDAGWESAKETIFSEPMVESYTEGNISEDISGEVFAIEFLPGQFDQRADSAVQCLQLIGESDARVACATVYTLEGNLSLDQIAKIKSYLINEVDSREASLGLVETLIPKIEPPKPVERIEGFIEFSAEAIEQLHKSLGLAMSTADLAFCQNYYKSDAKRNPSIAEIKLLDTYWSDHCRHTTFLTELTSVEFKSGELAEPVKAAWADYERVREILYAGRDDKPICLMDVALIGMKWLRKSGKLEDLEESEEVNAASIIIPVDIDGVEEEWLLMFKNETHNHPTEIEPFGGAATCLGGAIRDPLSGRSYVYQAMRVTGASDPRVPLEETLPGKLPQRKITVEAARGYSSYGNQIGLATGSVTEIYHPGYVAKRMEIGAVIAAAPRSQVRRLDPEPGDIIVLVGGRTGRDGIGGATGSSKEHTEEALDNSAEVQKGDPPMERKLQRLFRDHDVSYRVKRCNDFGAGGVSVAIGELAPSLDIDLDAVPLKYAGLDGTEIALSESQERMAVVLDEADVQPFLDASAQENLEAKVVAKVTDTGFLRMTWQGDKIVEISRDFLDTNGVRLEAKAKVKAPSTEAIPLYDLPEGGDLKSTWKSVLSDLNVCSQKGLVERFDSTVGAGSVLHPFGGKTRSTPTEAMVAKIPVLKGETSTVSFMAHGFQPEISDWSPYHGAVYAVLESVSRIVASGGDAAKVRLTFQEYFERLRDQPERWGKPLAALLGAWTAQKELGAAAIGGKDSMSGSFEDMDVPPTLVSFAVCHGKVNTVISPEFKSAGSSVVRISIPRDEKELPKWAQVNAIYKAIHDAIQQGDVEAISVIREGGLAGALSRMSFGSEIGIRLSNELDRADLFAKDYGSFVLEVSDPNALKNCPIELVGQTIEAFAVETSEGLIDLNELKSDWEQPLESIFPTQVDIPKSAHRDLEIESKAFSPFYAKTRVAKPRVTLPVFPGTNCEYDTQRAFERVGAEVDTVVFRNLTDETILASIDQLSKSIQSSQILMIPGGFSAGDEPAGSGKFIASVFRNAKLADATMNLIKNQDGLILGICNGFQALIKLGLVPFGEIRSLDENCPTLTFNEIGRHVSCYSRTKIVSNRSPWLASCQPGDEHIIAMSHGEGRFYAKPEILDSLISEDQIATQYIDANGRPSLVFPHNPNGSVFAVEGITSPCGKVLGKMGHSERAGDGIGLNVVGNKVQPIFESGVNYFK